MVCPIHFLSLGCTLVTRQSETVLYMYTRMVEVVMVEVATSNEGTLDAEQGEEETLREQMEAPREEEARVE